MLFLSVSLSELKDSLLIVRELFKSVDGANFFIDIFDPLLGLVRSFSLELQFVISKFYKEDIMFIRMQGTSSDIEQLVRVR